MGSIRRMEARQHNSQREGGFTQWQMTDSLELEGSQKNTDLSSHGCVCWDWTNDHIGLMGCYGTSRVLTRETRLCTTDGQEVQGCRIFFCNESMSVSESPVELTEG